RGLCDGGPDVLLLCEARKVKSGFVIRPLRQAAAVETDAGRGSAPVVRHAELCQRVPDRAGGGLVGCGGRAAVGKLDADTAAEHAGVGERSCVVATEPSGLDV